jgi:hypothetical protein
MSAPLSKELREKYHVRPILLEILIIIPIRSANVRSLSRESGQFTLVCSAVGPLHPREEG